MAWLNAVPDPPPVPAGRKPAARPPELSRREALDRRGRQPEIPPLDGAAYLLDYLWEFGPVAPAGQGVAPVTFTEMQAWQAPTGHVLSPWEWRTLRRLSAEYAAELSRATDRRRVAPYRAARTETPDEAQRRARELDRNLEKFFD